MLKALSILFAAVGLLYFLFYPFLKTAVNRKKLLNWFIILYLIAVTLSTIAHYFG